MLFQNMPQAAKALAAVNMKEIKGELFLTITKSENNHYLYAKMHENVINSSLAGRQVAVDWAISKDKYITTQETSSSGNSYSIY